jgi:hypothetical protein
MGTAKQDGATNVDEEPTMDMNLEVVVMPECDSLDDDGNLL